MHSRGTVGEPRISGHGELAAGRGLLRCGCVLRHGPAGHARGLGDCAGRLLGETGSGVRPAALPSLAAVRRTARFCEPPLNGDLQTQHRYLRTHTETEAEAE